VVSRPLESFLHFKHLYVKILDMQISEDHEANSQGIHVWLVLWKAARSLESHAHRSVRSLEMGLSDFGVLEALLHKGPLPVSAIGQKVLLTSGAMTAAVDRLEDRGLVERVNDPSDRRARIVQLTRAGAKLAREVFARHQRDMEHAVSCLTSSERRTLVPLLRKLGLGAASLSAATKETT
jgi:MarR family 2-MHQ and catechol resistance regulon transcriptional repressor